jgi:lipopolysaccharide transport system permease protein
MPNKLPETIYSPESQLRHPLFLIQNMGKDLLASRTLAWRLFIRNISAKYRQTMAGYLWAIFPPLLTSAVWIFLRAQNIFTVKEPSIPYPLYVFVGTILWQVFVNSINAPMFVVKDSATMIAKINFPREALIFAAFLEVLFNLAIQLCLLAGVFIYFDIPLCFGMIWGIGGIIGIIMMGMMAGILLTPISILYGDVQQGLPMVLQPLFYLTPIVYSAPEAGVGAILSTYNPISPLIQFTRELITTGKIICLEPSIIVCSITLIMLLIGWLLYRIAMPHLVERIAA